MTNRSGEARGKPGKAKSQARGRQRGRARKGKVGEVRLTPTEQARIRHYFKRVTSPEERNLISRFGEPLEEPLLIAFEPEDAAEGLYTVITSGVTYGVSSTVTLVTSTAQINALHDKDIPFRKIYLGPPA